MPKRIPYTTITFKGRDYVGGIMQEVPEELSKLLDETLERRRKEIETQQEIDVLAADQQAAKAEEIRQMIADPNVPNEAVLETAEALSEEPVVEAEATTDTPPATRGRRK